MNRKYFYRIIISLFFIGYKVGYSQDSLSFKKETQVSNFSTRTYYYLGENIVYEQKFDKETSNLLMERTLIGKKLNGIYKAYYPNGKLKTIMNYLLNVPVGIRATFHENGNIKTLYDYGYSESDINLELKEDFFVEYDSITNEEFGWGFSYYKPLNGKEYVYNQEGVLIEVIEYFKNRCLRVFFYDNNGNVTEKECPKE